MSTTEPVEITVTIKRGERTVTLSGLRALGFSVETKHDDDGFRSFFAALRDISYRQHPERIAIIAETPLVDEATGALYTMTVDPPLAPGEEF